MTTVVDTIPLQTRAGYLNFHPLTLDEALLELHETVDEWKIVITPNIHHLHLIESRPELISIYQGSTRLLPDGWPVAALLSALSNKSVSRCTGADLLESLVDSQGNGRNLVLVGGDSLEVLERLGSRASLNGWNPILEPAAAEEVNAPKSRQLLLRRIAAQAQGGVVALGLGAPKQELFAYDLQELAGRGHIICIGMAINFSAGESTRAPSLIQYFGLEWLHRISQEPKRLLPRYAKDIKTFLPLAISNLRKSK